MWRTLPHCTDEGLVVQDLPGFLYGVIVLLIMIVEDYRKSGRCTSAVLLDNCAGQNIIPAIGIEVQLLKLGQVKHLVQVNEAPANQTMH